MKSAPIPENEKERLVSLHNLGLLDTKPEERFDRITRIATKIFNIPISTLTLIDAKREWYKSCQGLVNHHADRAISFCGHALLSKPILVVPDARNDDRFRDNPMVVNEPYIRFYAGVPVTSADGQRVGVFCVKDTKPRNFSKNDEEILKGLAAWAEVEINSGNLILAINEGEKLRTEIEKSKATNEAMFTSIADGIVCVDRNLKTTFINKAAEIAIGWDNKEVIGKKWPEVIMLATEDGKSVPPKERPLYLAIHGEKIIRNVYLYTRKDKSKFPAAITVSAVRVDDKIIGGILAFRDITKERDIDKMKTEFVSVASHQLRTPLTGIKWFSELLMKSRLNVKNKDYVKQIAVSNERMVRLVDDLLNVSHIETGRKFSVALKNIDVIPLIKEAVKEQAQIASAKHITLDFSAKARQKIILPMDELKMKQVFQNLINNSIKYSEANTRVEIGCDRKTAETVFYVKDSGIGIPKRQQKQIFSKFFRAENVFTMHTDGTGLGLFIVKAIVEAHGGRIWFESVENKGTTFFFSLPIKLIK